MVRTTSCARRGKTSDEQTASTLTQIVRNDDYLGCAKVSNTKRITKKKTVQKNHFTSGQTCIWRSISNKEVAFEPHMLQRIVCICFTRFAIMLAAEYTRTHHHSGHFFVETHIHTHTQKHRDIFISSLDWSQRKKTKKKSRHLKQWNREKNARYKSITNSLKSPEELQFYFQLTNHRWLGNQKHWQ